MERYIPKEVLEELERGFTEAIKDNRYTEEQVERYRDAYMRGFLGRVAIEEDDADGR